MSQMFKAVLLAAVFATASGVAQANTITFNNIPADNDAYLNAGATFSSDGYDFWVNRCCVYFVNGNPSAGEASNGTTSLDLGGIVDMTSAANKPFSVTSVDLATLFAPGTSTVKFTGTDVDGAQTSQSFTNYGAANPYPYGLTTVSLAGFDHLTSFEMELVFNPVLGPGMDDVTYFSLVDNIVVNDAAASVPEPSTFAMLGLGLSMLTGALRRKPR